MIEITNLLDIEGPLYWRTSEGDYPIKVIDIVSLECGELYAQIEGSLTGIPLSQIVCGEEI